MYTEKSERRFRLAPPRIPGVRFAIIGNPRTGSSYLASLLDSHPDIACWNDEPFLEGGAFDRSGCQSPDEFLVDLVFNVNAHAVGFKLLWDAFVRLTDPWQMFRDLGISVVHIYRRNPLDAYLSLQLAKLNRAFTSFDGAYDQATVHVDIQHCRKWMSDAVARDQLLRERARAYAVPDLEVEYNEVCRDPTRVLDFLGVARCPLTSRLSKQRGRPQSATISNYREVVAGFAATRWEEFID